MRILNLAALILAALMLSPGPLVAETPPKILKAMSEDAPDATDHKFTGRYEGSFIVGQTVKAFDELALPDGAAAGKKFSSTITVSGRVTRIMYLTPEGRSSLEVFTNYRDKLTEKGFAPVFECFQLGANEHRGRDEPDECSTGQNNRLCSVQRQRIPTVGKTQNVFDCWHQIQGNALVHPAANGCVGAHIIAEALGADLFLYVVVVVHG